MKWLFEDVDGVCNQAGSASSMSLAVFFPVWITDVVSQVCIFSNVSLMDLSQEASRFRLFLYLAP